ncbi:hypothetical protein BH23ACT4_BH23ACT4_03940 [soil metagenome]
MTSLPTQGSPNLATRLDIERLEVRLDRLESKLDQQIRTYTVATVGAMTGLTAIFGMIVSVPG